MQVHDGGDLNVGAFGESNTVLKQYVEIKKDLG